MVTRSGARHLGMVVVGQGGGPAGWLLRWAASHDVAKFDYQPPFVVQTESFTFSICGFQADDKREEVRVGRLSEGERRLQNTK
jgi:hypothetical protein